MEITEDLGVSRKDPFLIKKIFQSASIETQWVKVKLASFFFFCRRLRELQCGGRGRLKGQASKPGQNTVTSKRQKPPVAIKEISSPCPSNPSPLACPPAPLCLPPETHLETVAPGSTTNSDLGKPESKEAQGQRLSPPWLSPPWLLYTPGEEDWEGGREGWHMLPEHKGKDLPGLHSSLTDCWVTWWGRPSPSLRQDLSLK